MSTHAILRWFYYRIPPRGRLVLRRLYYLPGDLFAQRDAMIPPKGMIFIGSGDFVEQVNRLWLDFYIFWTAVFLYIAILCKLTPDLHKILIIFRKLKWNENGHKMLYISFGFGNFKRKWQLELIDLIDDEEIKRWTWPLGRREFGGAIACVRKVCVYRDEWDVCVACEYRLGDLFAQAGGQAPFKTNEWSESGLSWTGCFDLFAVAC